MNIHLLITAALTVLPATLAGAAANVVCPPRTLWDQSYGGTHGEYLTDLQVVPSGFLAAGNAYDSGGQVSANYGGADVWVVMLGHDGALLWERSFGGNSTDYGRRIAPLPDGFAIGASSRSPPSGTKTSRLYGSQDFWLIRMDTNGVMLWDQSYGGTKYDELSDAVATSDGGYLLSGTSDSPISGNKTSPNRDLYPSGGDFWIVRTDGAGNKLWDQSYGGTNYDYLAMAVATADGGFLLGGTSASEPSGNKTAPKLGGSDFWIVRIDASGAIVWQRSFGGDQWDELRAITPTADGGFLLAGDSMSPGGTGNKTSAAIGGEDYWIVRIDANGEYLWDQSYGGLNYDSLFSAQALPDGGFILGGTSYSKSGETKNGAWLGGTDYWIVRVNAAGQKIWDQTYGGLREDDCQEVHALADGGLVLAGSSSSGKRGEKTAPRLGESDFWVVRLQQETPGDCDGDAVPDTTDQCMDTAVGDFVDANGCGLKQMCPCDQPWEVHADYVTCLETNTARLVAAGTMTEAQRQATLSAALVAECPPLPASVIVFGLTNVSVGESTLETSGDQSSQLVVSEVGPEGRDGVSLRVGQADSGIFISPYASIWGSFDEAWYMLGRAFGRVDGQAETLISRMVARKPYYETYPVEVDLSPLRPTSVTWQLWSNDVLVAETTTAEAIGVVTIGSSSELGPRANPFWRMPDGSVGALIELTAPAPEYTSISGPFGDEGIGDRIFIRANAPARTAEYLSYVDVTVGGGLLDFSVLDERPGVFRRPHRVLGPGLLVPSIERLQIDNPQSSNEHAGVLIELRDETRLNLLIEPLVLTNENASLLVSVNGQWTDATDFLGSLRLSRQTNGLEINPYLRLGGDLVDVKVYRYGVLQGMSEATNNSVAGYIIPAASGETPSVIAAGGGLSATGSVTVFAFTLDRVASYLGIDGHAYEGDYIEATTTNVSVLSRLSSVVAMTGQTPTLAIIGERPGQELPPIAIIRTGDQLTLTWPAHNLPVLLESSAALPGGFSTFPVEPQFQAGKYQLTLPAISAGSQFFRLRLAP